VPFGKDTVLFELKGLAVISEILPVDACTSKGAALAGCHIEVPTGILKLSLEE